MEACIFFSTFIRLDLTNGGNTDNLEGKTVESLVVHDDDRDACTLFAFAGQIEKRRRSGDS